MRHRSFQSLSASHDPHSFIGPDFTIVQSGQALLFFQFVSAVCHSHRIYGSDATTSVAQLDGLGIAVC